MPEIIISLMVIALFVFIFMKKRRSWKDYKKLDQTVFMENKSQGEKLSDFEDEYFKNKEINDLNKWGMP